MTDTADMTLAAEAMFAADEASRGLGVELLEHGEGTAALRMTATPAMVNGHGIAHGGYSLLLAGSAFTCACNSHGPVTVAAGADTTFGDEVIAEFRGRSRSIRGATSKEWG